MSPGFPGPIDGLPTIVELTRTARSLRKWKYRSDLPLELPSNGLPDCSSVV